MFPEFIELGKGGTTPNSTSSSIPGLEFTPLLSRASPSSLTFSFYIMETEAQTEQYVQGHTAIKDVCVTIFIQKTKEVK